jgi:hypothetical protein
MSTFFRIRVFRGKEYLYKEERWRSKGKMKSRSTCLGRLGGHRTDGKPPRATEEQWERHQQNARDLWLKIDSKARAPNSFESRNAAYRVSHSSFSHRAQERAAAIRAQVQAEDEKLDRAEKYPKSTPTPEEEAMHAGFIERRDDYLAQCSEEYATNPPEKGDESPS